MHSEYLKLIVELDRVLSMLRCLWLEAASEADRSKWRVRLDQSLDERLRLMRCRDALAPSSVPSVGCAL